MVKNKTIHIIIPVYNAEKFLNKCIDSILNQTYQNFNIYIINDGSTDTSLEIIKSYKDERIKIFSKENGGVSSARNYGIKQVPNTGYMTFIDADDWIGPKYLEILIDAIGDSDLVVAANHLVGSNKKEIVISQFNHKSSQGPYQKIFKSSIGNKIFFNENLYVGEDYEYNIRLFDTCSTFKIIDWRTIPYIFGQNPLSLTRRKINIKRIFDTFLGWFYAYRFLLEKNFYNNDDLRNVVLNKLCVEYLQFYGYYKKRYPYKIEEFNNIVSYFKKNKLIELFKPLGPKQNIKRFFYLYLKIIYKISYLHKKRNIIYF